LIVITSYYVTEQTIVHRVTLRLSPGLCFNSEIICNSCCFFNKLMVSWHARLREDLQGGIQIYYPTIVLNGFSHCTMYQLEKHVVLHLHPWL